MGMRVVAGGIMHETHTFSTEPTTLEGLAADRGEACFRYAGTNHSLGGVIDGCRELGINLVPTLFASSVSTGTIPDDVFETLADELVTLIVGALPADGIVLTLHGAMVSAGYPDADGEIVRRVRAAVGPTMAIAVTLDFHANVGPLLVGEATIITAYQTYPHVDIADRAREAVVLLSRTIEQEIRPVMALVQPPLLPVPQAQFTGRPPLRTLLDRTREIERGGEVVAVTVAGGFAYADIPDAGLSLLVTTDGDAATARRIAADLADLAWSLRHQMLVQNRSPREAVAEALASPVAPVVLVDVGDNIGGGTPGDGTVLLSELLAQGADEATIVIADPEAVTAAVAVGVGGTLRTAVGGKVDRLHGEPVPITGRVVRLGDGRWVHEGPENAGVPAEMGTTAVVQVDGVNLVLTSVKSMPGDLQQLRSVGIVPEQQKILVVKAAVRWRGGYESIVRHAIDVDTPGLGSVDLARFPFQRIRRPIFPLDPEMAWTATRE